MYSAPHRLRRAMLATAVLASLLVLVPAPQLVWASEMTTESHSPTVRAAGADAVDPASVLATVAVEHAGHGDTATPDTASSSRAARDLVRDDAAGRFSAIGVTWDREPPSDAILRTRAGGEWGDWRPLVFSDDHWPDDMPYVPTSEPLYVGDASGYEIQFPAASGEPVVHLVKEAKTQRRIAWTGPTAHGDASIHPRSAWGARAPKAIPTESATLELAVVHHSVTSNSYSSAEVPSILRSIQAYHMDARGWDDIGYNFAVDRFGRIWEARAGGTDRPVIGGHARGFNVGSTGVVMLGSYQSTTPSSASLKALSDVIAWKFAEHHVPPTGTVAYRPQISTHHGPEGTPVTVSRVVGHRDVGQTSCPGSGVYGRLGSIRSEIVQRVPTHQATAPSILLAGDRTGDGREDVLAYHPGSRTDLNFNGRLGPDLAVSNLSVSGLYEPLTGDFDGNGLTDVFWYQPGAGSDYIWYSNVGQGYRNVATQIRGDYIAFVGDFDGNGADDIFWYGDYGEIDTIYWGGPAGFTAARVAVHGHFTPLVGDFDGDGADDILWYGYGSRGDAISWGTPTRNFSHVATKVSGLYQPFVGDFDGSGTDDIFWYSPGGGGDYIWSGAKTRNFGSSAATVNGVFRPVVGDFDNNGRDDIMWYAEGSAPDYQWLHTPTGRQSLSRPVSGDYEVAVIDADGLRGDEIVWVADNDVTYLWSRSLDGSHVSKRIR